MSSLTFSSVSAKGVKAVTFKVSSADVFRMKSRNSNCKVHSQLVMCGGREWCNCPSCHQSLALRAGHEGPSPKPVGCQRTARAAPVARAGRRVPARGRTGNGSFEGFSRVTNNRLRTGTDKGNPTV
ncbi:hypothetical protein PTKIN_Ptkin10aG0077000 [Pterospermum kingtungense]